MLGVSTGGRISELLSLTIGDVYQNRAAVTDLLFDKSQKPYICYSEIQGDLCEVQDFYLNIVRIAFTFICVRVGV
jgi:hypothetical protein